MEQSQRGETAPHAEVLKRFYMKGFVIETQNIILNIYDLNI